MSALTDKLRSDNDLESALVVINALEAAIESAPPDPMTTDSERLSSFYHRWLIWLDGPHKKAQAAIDAAMEGKKA